MVTEEDQLDFATVRIWSKILEKLVDGTTLSMPDTEANQAEYPQHIV